MITNELIIQLLSIKGVGRKSAKKIIDNLDFKIDTENEFMEFILETSQNIPRLNLNKEIIYEGFEKGNVIIDNSEKNDIFFINYKSGKFPNLLSTIDDIPLILSCKGNVNSIKDKSIAIIGTREPSVYGAKVGVRLSEFFTDKNYTIVSGLAIGCDTTAHRGCLNKNGETIAVLAHGLHTIYPKENKELAYEIIDKNGLLISEYFIGAAPLANYFVERDRLQAGLSQSVFVVETGIKGGTLHTVKFCENNKRPVACFNHPLEYRNNSKAEGNQMLINNKRAIPIYSEDELIEFERKLSNYVELKSDINSENKLDIDIISNTKQLGLWD